MLNPVDFEETITNAMVLAMAMPFVFGGGGFPSSPFPPNALTTATGDPLTTTTGDILTS